MPSFEERYKKLNAEQREAVDTTEGPVMVIAGPGTGKTEILTMRIANILRGTGAEKVRPERILALTFTESGAVSMRKRLAELVGQDAYRVQISTFHGFANRVIRDYPEYFPAIIGASNITEIDQVRVLRRLIDELPLKELRPFGERYHYLRNILGAIGEIKRQGVPPEAFADIALRARKAFYENPDLINQSGKYEGKMKTKYLGAANHIARNMELSSVYAEYQKALVAAKQYDYSDMIMYVARALEENEELRRVLQGAYAYFLIDEHQDTNDAQNKMIELLVGDGDAPNLFVVGDEKQAIFRFQGASLENFHYFSKRYHGVKLVPLRSNYRSTQAILNAAQGVSPREVELTARAGHVEVPAHLAVLSSPDVEYFFIARKIREFLSGGTPPEEIAVLYRDNGDAAPLVRMLEKEKIPFNIESDQDVLGDQEIRKLVRILRAVEHFGNDPALVEVLHVDFLGIPPIDVYRLASFAAKRRMKMYDVLRSEAMLHEAEIGAIAACLALFDHLSTWKRATKNKGAAEAFESIVRDSGFLVNVLKHPSATEKLAKLHAMFDLLKSFIERRKDYTLDDFFEYLDLIEEHGIVVKSADTLRLSGRVRLMTAHRSKGQEFDRVFVMGAVDRKWGSRFRRESIKLPKGIYRVLEGADRELADEDDGPNDDADERNVFYVALTRARNEVFVTMSDTDREGREQLPTKFIAELKNDVLTPYDTAPYENEFGGRREMEFAPTDTKVPELKDKDFLKQLFEGQGISVTALNNYLECPWRYFYLNLIRIPEAPNKHLSFGNAIHAALKNYFDAFAAGEDKGKAYLVQRFEEALAREPIARNEYDEALEKGRKALPAFYDAYRPQWPEKALNEMRVADVRVSDGTLINGKLDRVELLDNGRAKVVDYKTGRPKSRNDIEGNTKSSDGNYKRQLVFYKLLLDKEGTYAMDEGVIQFIEPDERGKFHREEFSITTGETKVLTAQIETVAQEIRTLSFWDRPCDDKDCKYCELHKMTE